MIRSSGIYMLGRSLTAALTLASIAIFSRLLAPSDYGVYTLTITTAGIFNSLFCTWVIQAAFRIYRDQPDRVALQSSAVFALMFSASVSAAAALVALHFSGVSTTLQLAIGIAMLVAGYSAYEFSNIQLTLLQRPSLFVQLQFAKLLLTLTLPLAAFLLWRRFDYFMLAMGATYWIPLAFPRFLTWSSGISFRRVDRSIVKALARYGIPLSVSLVLVLIGSSLDRYILGMQRGVGNVAGYAAGADLALFPISMIGSSLNQAFFPRVLELHAEGRDAEQQQFYSQYILLFVALLLPASVGLHFVSDKFAWLITGKAIRADAIGAMSVFAITAFFLTLKSFVIDLRFQIAKRTALPIVSATFMILLLVGGCFLLIPVYGNVGAALASLVAAAGGCALAAILSTYLPGAWLLPLADLTKVIAAVAVMAAVLYGTGEWFVVADSVPVAAVFLGMQTVVGIATYLAALMILGFRPARQFGNRFAEFRARSRSL